MKMHKFLVLACVLAVTPLSNAFGGFTSPRFLGMRSTGLRMWMRKPSSKQIRMVIQTI